LYKYKWDIETGGYLLTTNLAGVSKELRPVFYEELDLLGFDKLNWKYPKTDKPLMWAETRRYIYKGELVAEAVGGGLFTKPTIKLHKDNFIIEPVNIDLMIKKNKPLMIGLVQNTVETIYEVYKKHKDANIDVIYVAFSGGKDSLVLLDLVQRSLPHNEFKVIFSDTSMEISDTYKTVEEVKKRYPTLEFHTAKSHIDATKSWDIFGPPGRVQRWCCAVHKSVPSLLKLRELIGIKNLKVLVFDGVRAEESNARATYSIESKGKKHLIQTNCSPILNWGTNELFLYIFENSLIFNKAYRYGAVRVGCAICPLASKWWEFIVNSIYPDRIKPFIDIIKSNANTKFSNSDELIKYLDDGGWKGRMGGRDLNNGGNRIVEQSSKGHLVLQIKEISSDWKEWIKALGNLIHGEENVYFIEYENNFYKFRTETVNNTLKIIIKNNFNKKKDIRFKYLFKNVFYKTAYCAFCKTCMVECPFGALDIDNGKIKINTNCKHCHACLDMPKGCLVAKSLSLTIGGRNMELKGINRYQHFGFRKIWLRYFLEYKNNFWNCDKLGKYQFDGFKIWLKESELTKNNLFNDNAEAILKIGIDDIRIWAVILNNLIYNSVIMKWYVKNIQFDIKYDITTMITMLGDDLSISTRENALTSLKETFRYSPIGSELGAGICEIKGNSVKSITRSTWNNPDPVVILYSLYKFAEKCDGHYSFTLSYLCDDSIERGGISPSKIFGILPIVIKRKIQNLATDYRDFISVAFNKDLDNIDLVKGKTSFDVLKLF